MPPSVPPTFPAVAGDRNNFALFGRILAYVGSIFLLLGTLCPAGVHLPGDRALEVAMQVMCVKIGAILFGGFLFVSGSLFWSRSSSAVRTYEHTIMGLVFLLCMVRFGFNIIFAFLFAWGFI